MKMYEIIDFVNLFENLKNDKMSLKTAYKFSKLMRVFEKEIAFYQEEFAKIIQTYAKKDSTDNIVFSEDGESIEVIDGKEIECNTKILELRNLDVPIDGIKFSIEELEGIDVSISELSCLMSLIED